MSARAVVERYVIEVLGRSGAARIDDLVTDEELRRRSGAVLGGFPDLVVDQPILAGEGELVAAHVRARGTHLGLFMGVPPTGTACELRCTGVYRVAHGRIAEAWVTWDHLSLMEQLGAVERAAAVSA